MVIFVPWQKLHLGLDALSNQKILNGIYYRGCSLKKANNSFLGSVNKQSSRLRTSGTQNKDEGTRKDGSSPVASQQSLARAQLLMCALGLVCAPYVPFGFLQLIARAARALLLRRRRWRRHRGVDFEVHMKKHTVGCKRPR